MVVCTFLQGDLSMSSIYNNKPKKVGPLAVGALGGSGTRVVAQILQEIGFYIGGDLNHALDNLWFTFLFKRPKWLTKNIIKDQAAVFKYIHLFEKKMTGADIKFDEYLTILKIALEIISYGPKSSQGLWLARRVTSIMGSGKKNYLPYIGWGWKEPNTHIYLEHLSRYFIDLKYIHVIRHGLDMAYSSNQQQLYNWGKFLDIETKNKSKLLPQNSLRFWIEANRRAINIGNKFLKERFFLLNFDNLCHSPKREISLLLDFLGIKIDNEKMQLLEKLPQVPKSSGRYKKHDISIFTKEEIGEVKKFGFTI